MAIVVTPSTALPSFDDTLKRSYSSVFNSSTPTTTAAPQTTSSTTTTDDLWSNTQDNANDDDDDDAMLSAIFSNDEIVPPSTKKRKTCAVTTSIISDDEQEITAPSLVETIAWDESSYFFIPSVNGAKQFMSSLLRDTPSSTTTDIYARAKAFAQELQRFNDLQQQSLPSRTTRPFLTQTMGFLTQRNTFSKLGRDSQVTLAYHYTNNNNSTTTATDITLPSPKSKVGGSKFGPGVYVSTRPDGLCFRGDTGIIVAIIKGKTVRVGKKGKTEDDDINTAIGNQKLRDYRVRSVDDAVYLDETVLKEETQCLPLLAFPADIVRRGDWADLGVCYDALKLLVDTHLNQ